jgi:hypothetical protein
MTDERHMRLLLKCAIGFLLCLMSVQVAVMILLPLH